MMTEKDWSCPIKMNTHDENGQQVVCMSKTHHHCGGCYEIIPPEFIFCDEDCREMFESYDPKEGGDI